MGKNNYFDNKAIEAIIKKYQNSVKEDENNKGDMTIVHPYTSQFQQLVKAVINTHKIYRFHNDIEELSQEGLSALFSSLRRFDPTKGTAFNYLSIVVKQHLKNWTQSKNKKEWVTGELNEETYDGHYDDIYDVYAIKESLSQLDVEGEQEIILERIISLITNDKVAYKRDIVKVLLAEGWARDDINSVYTKLEEKFGMDASSDEEE